MMLQRDSKEQSHRARLIIASIWGSFWSLGLLGKFGDTDDIPGLLFFAGLLIFYVSLGERAYTAIHEIKSKGIMIYAVISGATCTFTCAVTLVSPTAFIGLLIFLIPFLLIVSVIFW
jgi:hypothetical protein